MNMNKTGDNMDDYKEIIVKEYHNEKGLITRREIGEELVRCKDCKFNNRYNKCLNEHSIIDIPKDDDYCSYGEKNE